MAVPIPLYGKSLLQAQAHVARHPHGRAMRRFWMLASGARQLIAAGYLADAMQAIEAIELIAGGLPSREHQALARRAAREAHALRGALASAALAIMAADMGAAAC
jgi:hypothetical protein